MSSTALPKKVSGYVRLGNSGLKVSSVVLGCMSYGDKGPGMPWVIDEAGGAIEHIKAAFDMGINTFDTANVYSNGSSERILGTALKTLNIPREEVVILTKVHRPMAKTGPNLEGLSRKHIFDSIRASLDRLQLDYVDVFQCHRFDYDTPISETMDALHDVVKLGLARYIGMSSCYAWQFAEMQNYAKSKGQTQFISMQNQVNAVYREEEREMIPYCTSTGVGTDKMYSLFKKNLNEPALEKINDEVARIAKEKGLSMAQVALAWVIAQKGITAPIIGSTKISSIEELVQATHVKLTEEEVEAISREYVPRRIEGNL